MGDSRGGGLDLFSGSSMISADMNITDPIEESRRLQELYRNMTDEEVEAVANEAYQLTDLARETLQTEVRSRRLEIGLKNAPVDEEPSFADDDLDLDPADLDLVPLSRVWDLDKARQTKSTLLEAGIPCFLGPDNIAKLELFDSVFRPGMDLKVRGVDRQTATAVLAEFTPNTGLGEEAETNAIACCPRCHSLEIVFQSLDLSPDPKSDADSKFNWSCDACGYQWTDDGVEQEVSMPEDEEGTKTC